MINHSFGVSLGPIEEKNLDQIRSWRNNYQIWKTCRQNDLIDAQSHRHWFDSISKDDTVKMYEIHTLENKLAGVCGLTSIDLYNRRAEFSLYVGPEHWGNGYGKRALQTLVQHGFKTLGLNSIWGETFEGNSAISMFKELGFKHEGIRREFYFREGSFIDAHLFSIVATDWQRGLASRRAA